MSLNLRQLTASARTSLQLGNFRKTMDKTSSGRSSRLCVGAAIINWQLGSRLMMTITTSIDSFYVWPMTWSALSNRTRFLDLQVIFGQCNLWGQLLFTGLRTALRARTHSRGKCQMIVLSKLFLYAKHNRALIGVSLNGNSTAKFQINIVLEKVFYKICIKVYFIIVCRNFYNSRS